MDQKQIDKIIAMVRIQALKIADRVPLPLHYILNGFLIVFWLGDMAVPDPLPFLDEIFGAFGLWYYNAYLLHRTFGVINPWRIIRGESPASKRRLGLLAYEQQMEQIKKRLKNFRRAASELGLPGLEAKRVEGLATEVKKLEKRLQLLDRLLTRPEFQEGKVTHEISRFEARRELVDDPELKKEYGQAIEHARAHLGNIGLLREERNRLVARLERFNLQLDRTYSQLLAMSSATESAADTGRLFDELFNAVSAFESSLLELEAKPAPSLYQDAVKEIEENEAKFRLRRENPTRTL
jgi:hypothetical protein